MDPVSTPPAQMSHSGRMHGLAFMLGVPSMVLAVLVLSFAFDGQVSYTGWLLKTVAAVIWISLIVMIGIMLRVGPGKPPDPNGLERFVGVPNRLLMVAYAVWLMVADAVAMIAAGTAIALPLVWGLSRLVEAQLFGVHALDAPTIAVASLVLALVALAAAMLPAWRAASVSPTEALRFE